MVEAHDPLRRSVSLLGAILGETLVREEGEPFFELEESVRALAKRRRAAHRDDSLDQALEGTIAAMDVATAERIARAFSQYFQLVNLAEQYHRVRRRRSHDREGTEAEGGLEAHIGELAARTTKEAVSALLSRLSIELVFTAHPTEAQRRTVLEKHGRIARLLDTLEVIDLTPSERREAETTLREEVALLYQSDEIRVLRPRVGDEVKNVLFYLEEVLYPLVPRVYESLERSLEAAFGEPFEAPPCLRFGSWVGADMDGNPNVTPEVALDTAYALSAHVLALHLTEVARLGELLSQSERRVKVSPELLASIERDRAAFPRLLAADDPRTHEEPYRRKLRIVETRLRANREAVVRARHGEPVRPDDRAEAYPTPAALCADLRILEASLESHHGTKAGLRHVRALRRRVEVFGFHFARLDVRVPSAWMREAVARATFRAPDDALALPVLQEAASGPQVLASPEGPGMHALRALSAMQRELYPDSAETFILSMARGRTDLLATLALARVAGLYDPAAGTATVSITPLFETLDDLTRAPDELRAALTDPAYARYVATRGGVQEVMLGYSDSNKDAGIVASSFALYEAQRKLVALARELGVAIKVFHGRGGSIGRGGGPAQRAIEGLPKDAIDGRFKLTEQGEVIGWKYLLPSIAERNLEQTMGGVLRASLVSDYPDDEELSAYETVFAEVARRSVEAYRALVRDPRFVEYYVESTPLEEIGALPLGSRPARRSGQATLDDLRAIPWVFAFTQSRQNVPGFYGAGTALRWLLDTHGLPFAQRMHARWPFFSTMLDAIGVAVATSDMRIARHYASLVPDQALARRMFRRIALEHGHTARVVRAIQGRESLLERKPRLARSIELRNPYVDPMSFVQVELLRRKRALVAAGEPVPAGLDRAILLTINGIAAGLRNTG